MTGCCWKSSHWKGFRPVCRGSPFSFIGPYTGRALTPLATIDLVGWDIHRAIVDNVYEKTQDEAHESLRLPDFMARLMDEGVLGDKSGAGFFKRDGKTRLVLDFASGDYQPVADVKLPDMAYVDDVANLYTQGRYQEGMQVFLCAQGDEAALARKVVAGYISYAFHRVGEVADDLGAIDRIMGTGFNWAPPGVLVDVMGPKAAVAMIEAAGLSVPDALVSAAQSGKPKNFFQHPHINIGRFFVAC